MKYVSVSIPGLLASGLVLSSACGKLPGFAVNEKTDAFLQQPQLNDKVDILFVVDNSGSMAQEQEVLTESFGDFITAFSDRKLKFQVGVMSTDVLNNSGHWSSSTGAYKNFPNQGPGSLLGFKRPSGAVNERILTPDVPDFVTKFKENAKLGIAGDGGEAGLFATIFGLSAEKLAGWNAGFVRPEALLAIIFVSDEDESRARDYGTAGNSHYIRQYPTLKAARIEQFSNTIRSLKPNQDELLRVSAIVARNKAECPSVFATNGLDGTGDVYMEVAETFKGKISNLCANFSQDLLDIGSELLTLLSRFKLQQVPDGQIEVRVDNVLVPRDPVNGWEYLAETNEVEFRGEAVPSSEATIGVTYIPGAPLR